MSASPAKPERELTLVRIFDASRDVVYRDWTDPTQMKRWFGPRCFTNPHCELDVRPGGTWRIVMRSPQGSEHPCGGVYKEVVPAIRLAFTNNALDLDGNLLLEGFTTVSFESVGNKTRLTLHTRATGHVAFAEQMLAGMEEGWNQTLDKLGETVVTSDREIVIERTFDAPRSLVFAAFTDPRHIAKWWGPNGFANTIRSMDVQPGGVWNFVMHGPDGVDYENTIVYTEVVKPERLAYRHGETVDAEPHFEVTITFTEQNGKTHLTMSSLFPTAAARDKVVKEFHAIEGGNQTLDRFGSFLNTRLKVTTPTDNEIVMQRVFSASPQQVFDAFTRPELVKRWWGFDNSELTVCEIDLRPGGNWRYVLKMQSGGQMARHGVFHEVTPPHRLVQTDVYEDPALGNPEWLSTTLFEPHPQGTLITNTCLHPSQQQRDGHLYSGMEAGVTQTFDRLEKLLGDL